MEEDPDSANRQIARLKGDVYLETTVTGRRQENPTPTPSWPMNWCCRSFMRQAAAAEPDRTLSRYNRCGKDIALSNGKGYASPGESLQDQAIAQHHYLRFTPLPGSIHQFEFDWSRHWNRGCSLG